MSEAPTASQLAARARAKRWRETHREEHLAALKKWRLDNPQKCREIHKRNGTGRKGRNANLKRYGITLDDFEAMAARQGGCCACCGGPPVGRWKVLHVDHDHQTGKVRGLLCLSCNVLIGHAKESVERLQAAITYIKRTTTL